MGVVAAKPHRTPQTDSSTPLSPARRLHSAVLALPTRCTSRRSRPRKTGTSLEQPRETGNSPAPHSPNPPLLPVVRTSTHPPTERCHYKHTAPLHAPPAPPALPISHHSLQTCPDSQTRTSPHSRFCSRNSGRLQVCLQTARCPSQAQPSTPGRIASHLFRIAGSTPPDRVPSLWTCTFSPRSPCAPASADKRRGRALWP